jgi:hypothetical protein
MYLVNFADKKFKAAQHFNSKTGIAVGKFESVFEYDDTSIDPFFYSLNEKILNQSKGFGYWLWKPYIIKNTLQKISDGEVLLYSDSASFFISDVRELEKLPTLFKQDIIPFELDWPESMYTKRDTFTMLGVDGLGYESSNQRLASFILIRKSDFSVNFINEYLYYSCNEQILTDLPNICGLPNFNNFVEHRHDQSIFSLLTKKHNLKPFRDISQWGNHRFDEFKNSIYPQIIEHSRNKAPKTINTFYSFLKNILKKYFSRK